MRDENEVRQRVRGPLWAVTALSGGLILGAIGAVLSRRSAGKGVSVDRSSMVSNLGGRGSEPR
jgi:hypothetical protein